MLRRVSPAGLRIAASSREQRRCRSSMPTCTASSSASRSNAYCGASATAQSCAIRARHTGELGHHGQFHRRREVLLRLGAPAEQRGQVAAQPIGGSEVHREAHLHRLAREGVELEVQHVGALAVGQRRAHLGEIGEASGPRGVARYRCETVGRQRLEFPTRLLEHADVGEERREAWPPHRRVGLQRGGNSHRRHHFLEPALLAADGIHLHSVHAGAELGARRGGESHRPLGQFLRLVEASVDQGEHHVEGDRLVPVEHELAPLGCLAQLRQAVSRLGHPPQSHQATHVRPAGIAVDPRVVVRQRQLAHFGGQLRGRRTGPPRRSLRTAGRT